MGLPEFTINWLKILYTDITSSCVINGNITKEFKIKRGVRQGCPLSMLIYVIFQEPLYQAIDKNTRIKPISILNQKSKELGYADDTTIIVNDDEGFLEAFKIISMFESASNSKININKTRIYGFGDWRWRVQWPIRGLKTEFDYFTALGVIFSTDYDKALHTTWKRIFEKIKKGLAAMTGRYMNIYQKAVLINAIIASKLWYTSHVYPLPTEYVKLINTEIFKYIWNSSVDPIKRNVLYMGKDKGGINLINVHVKSKCIFANTVLKMFLNPDDFGFTKYYITAKMNKILGLRNSQPNRVLPPPYYDYAIDIIKKCTSINGFPNINSKKIYFILTLSSPMFWPRRANDSYVILLITSTHH